MTALDLVTQEFQEVNDTILNFVIMALNANMNHRIDWGNLEEGFIKRRTFCKRCFFPPDSNPEELYENYVETGVEVDETHFFIEKPSIERGIQADRVRNARLDKIVAKIVWDFEQLVLERAKSIKSHTFSSKSRPLKMNPNDPSHQHIAHMASNIGALLYHLAAHPTPYPSIFSKQSFIEKRKQDGWKGTERRSRALEFLIGGAFYLGHVDIRGFRSESKCIQDVLLKTLEHFKNDWMKIEQSLMNGGFKQMSLSNHINAILYIENRD